MSDIIQSIQDLISPVFTENNVYLLDINLRGQKGSHVLEVVADTPKGIGMDEISSIARKVNLILEETDIIKGKYRINVASPGPDRELQLAWEYEKNLTRNLKVIYTDDSGECKVEGKLTSVSEDIITIEVKKKVFEIPLSNITSAKVQFKW